MALPTTTSRRFGSPWMTGDAECSPIPQCTIFYSTANELELSDVLGHQHYSYRTAEGHFLAVLEANGVPFAHLPMPEYYGHRSTLAAEFKGLAPHPIHLIFRSTEDIRLLKCAYNITYFAWEFDVLKDETLVGEHPFLNQKRMLGICDEIWAPSEYSRDVLCAHGLGNVHFVPTPIAMPQEQPSDRYEVLLRVADLTVCPLFVNFLMPLGLNHDICAARSVSLGEWLARKMAGRDQLRIYLTILNPEDFRKNLDAVLRGFYYFAAEHPQSVLLVKAVTSQSRFSLPDVVADVVRAKMAPGTNLECDNIAFFNDFLDEEALSSLYSLADFYLCAPVAEGQNAPLLEAMAHGVVPVTTHHTAMLDYITEKNAVIIRDREIACDSEHFAGCVAGKPFRIHRSESSDVYDALKRSTAIPQTRRSEISRQCIDIVRERYSYQRAWELMSARLARVTGGPVVAVE